MNQEDEEYVAAMHAMADAEPRNSIFAHAYIRLATFVSTSAGRGRSRRPREVQLLQVNNATYQLIGEEVRRRLKDDGNLQPDQLARDLLEHMSPDERTVGALLDVICGELGWQLNGTIGKRKRNGKN